MKTIRIASGAGFAGDRIEPALDIICRGNSDYIIFECLAERTIALAQAEKLTNPETGYNPLLNYRMEKIIPLLKEHPIKIITNMGAANPEAAAKRIRQLARKNGLNHLKVVAVLDDDVLGYVAGNSQLEIMENGAKLSSISGKIISANAYIGGHSITKALDLGADIVVTGRVADASLTTGPLMYEFKRAYDDYDFLGKTVVAGHLLECGGQVTGGYFADPGSKDVPELWNIGFPILNFHEDGTMELEKLPDTGGLLNTGTVKEQLLYEIQDPSNYFAPDVVADFSRLRAAGCADGKVRVSGATGKPKTGTLKVSVGYVDGWIGTGEISYGGHNCVARAKLAQEIIEHRIETLPFEPIEVRLDMIGLNSLYKGAIPKSGEPAEVRFKASIRTQTEQEALEIGREVEALYTNGPAGGGGVRSQVTRVVSVASVLIPESEISEKVVWIGDNI